MSFFRQRERPVTKQEVGVVTYYQTDVDDHPTPTYYPYNSTVITSNEALTDENHTKKYGNAFGECVHVVAKCVGSAGFDAILADGGQVIIPPGSITGNRFIADTDLSDLTNLALYMPSAMLDRIGTQCDVFLRDCVTQIKESFSLMNDLLDIEDFKNIIPKFQSTVQFLRDLLLSYQFGIKPTYDDGKKLVFSSFQLTKERIEFLRKFNGKTVKVHRSFTLNSDDFEFEARDFTSVVPFATLQAQVYSYQVEYELSARVKLDLSNLNDFFALMDAYSTALGFTNGVKVAWNKIPMSFVIEWFVNLDSFLETFHEAPFKGSLTVTDSWVSSKVTILYDIFGNIDQRHGADPVWSKTGLSVYTQTFRRTKGLPLSGSLLSGHLSPLEDLLLGALIHQRIPHL